MEKCAFTDVQIGNSWIFMKNTIYIFNCCRSMIICFINQITKKFITVFVVVCFLVFSKQTSFTLQIKHTDSEFLDLYMSDVSFFVNILWIFLFSVVKVPVFLRAHPNNQVSDQNRYISLKNMTTTRYLNYFLLNTKFMHKLVFKKES